MKKAYILLDVLISISLILILSSIILPSLISTVKRQESLVEREKMLRILNNQMENITSSIYYNENLKILEDEDFEIIVSKSDFKDNLLKVKLVVENEKGEISLEKYFKKEGFYSN